MNGHFREGSLSLLGVSLISAAFAASPASAGFIQQNLVSDLPGLATNPPDSQLNNPWGMAASAMGPIWISDNNAGASTVYSGQGVKTLTLHPTIAPPKSQVGNPNFPSAPTRTVHVCSSCHGLNGNSISPTFPRLAGQRAEYLETQLKAFRDKTRADPHARTYMWGMAAHLSDSLIHGLAEYFAAQTPSAGTLDDSAQMAAGKKIFEEGIPDRPVPACQGCHGDRALGDGVTPRLASQHRDYLVEQLTNFASNARQNEIMYENSKNLTADEINQVAAYLASL